MSNTINGRPVAPPGPQNVISRSAILILSGILLGTALAQGDLGGISFYRFVAGVVGLIAFYALDVVAQGQRSRIVRSKLAAADSFLEGRLRRHVPASDAAPSSRTRRTIGESSYLPVAGTKW
jgi:hypothetical protein